MQAAVWKSLPAMRNLRSPPLHFASFHSSPISLDKWKENWKQRDKGASEQSKSCIRYSVRQKRADAKKALKDFLLYGKTSKPHFQDEDGGCRKKRTSNRKVKLENGSHGFDNIRQENKPGNSKPPSSSAKGKQGGTNRWRNNPRFVDDEDFGAFDTIYQSTFGGRRGFTWSFSSWENSHDEESTTTAGFEWRDESRRERTQKRVFCNESDVDDDPSTTDVGSSSHRLALGLPPTGPLKMDDVKSAFRASALKWHPDKHQGSLRVVAEERFKLCVDAYNSLRGALNSA